MGLITRCQALFIIIFFCLFYTNNISSSHSKVVPLTEKDHNRLIEQFDQWVFGGGRQKYVIKHTSSVSQRISLTKLPSHKYLFFGDTSFGVTIRYAQAHVDAPHLLRSYMHNESSRLLHLERLKKKKISWSNIYVLNSDHRDFEQFTREFEIGNESLNVIYDEIGKKNYCFYRRYKTHQRGWLSSENKILSTFIFVKLYSKPTKLQRKEASACLAGGILYHWGASYIFGVVNKETNQLISEYKEKFFTNDWNFFPIWMLNRKEIYNGMSREEALEYARKIVPVWVKCCGGKEEE